MSSIPEKPTKVKPRVDLEALARSAKTDIKDIRPPIKFTPEKKEQFLEILRTNANLSVSARSVGISPSTVSDHRLHDPDFNQDCEDAINEAADYMESEIIRRGFQGVEKGVYYQGMKVDTETQYSDTLALRALEAIRPDKWASRSNVNVKKEIDVTVSDTKMKLLKKLGIDEDDIIEADIVDD